MGSRSSRAVLFAGWIAVLIAVIALGCERNNCPPNAPCPTPTPGGSGSCANVSGTRNMFWNDTCSRSGSGTIALAQSGCAFTGTLADFGTFSGTVSGNTLSFTLTFTDPCSGSASGTAMVSGTTVSGSYSGTETGAAACCGAVTGTFVFDFSPTRPPTTVTPTPPPV